MDIVEYAKDKVKHCWETLADFRDEAYDDMQYSVGEQWTSESLANRTGRPCNVINDAIVNIRKTKENYKKKQATFFVRPTDTGKQDKDKADVYNGLVRSIRRDSMFEDVMDRAFTDMLSCGMGFTEICTEEKEGSFDQEIKVKYIKDPFSCFWDLSAECLDLSDADYAGYLFDIDFKEYEEMYPDATTFGSFPAYDGHMQTSGNGCITLCKIYYADNYKDMLYAVADPFLMGKSYNFYGSEIDSEEHQEIVSFWRSEYEDFDGGDVIGWLKENGKIIGKRTAIRRRIKWAVVNDTEEIDGGEVDGDYIRVIPMLGDAYWMNDSRYFWSLIRAEKPSGRGYNFMVSNLEERLASQPVAPYIINPLAIEGMEGIWAGANNEPRPYLPIKGIRNADGTIDNSYMPTPAAPADIPAGWMAGADLMAGNKQNTSGLQDSAMGIQGNEISARAIMERSENSLQTVNVFFENRRFATQLSGRVIADLIPHVYDTPTTVQIIGGDGKENAVLLNATNPQGSEYEGKVFDLKNDKFDIWIDVGPSRDSKKLDQQATLLEAMRLLPEQMTIAMADDLVATMDLQNVDEAVQKVRKMQPAELHSEDEKTKDQLEAENAQKDQQLEQMQVQVEQMTQMLQSEKIKSEGRLEEARLKGQVDLQKETLKQQSETKRTMIENQTDLEEQRIESETDIQVALINNMAKEIENLKATVATITPQQARA